MTETPTPISTRDQLQAQVEQRKRHRARLNGYRRRVRWAAEERAEQRDDVRRTPLPPLAHGATYLALRDVAKLVSRMGYPYSERSLQRLAPRWVVNDYLMKVLAKPEPWAARIPCVGRERYKIVCKGSAMKPDLLEYATTRHLVDLRTYRNPLVALLETLEARPTTSLRQLRVAVGNVHVDGIARLEHLMIGAGIIQVIHISAFGRTYRVLRHPVDDELDHLVLQG
jgi:hypothetical protein